MSVIGMNAAVSVNSSSATVARPDRPFSFFFVFAGLAIGGIHSSVHISSANAGGGAGKIADWRLVILEELHVQFKCVHVVVRVGWGDPSVLQTRPSVRGDNAWSHTTESWSCVRFVSKLCHRMKILVEGKYLF